jgi:hypothetical protein
MYMTIREYRCDPAAMGNIMHLIDEHFADEMTQMPGFIAYEAIDCGPGQLITTTTFADRDAAERSTQLANDFIHDHLADVELNRTAVYTGHVLVNRAVREVTEPVHA